VRSPAEYDAAHLPGSVLLPLDQLRPDRLRELQIPLEGDFFVLCQSGGRARKAARQLAASGFLRSWVVEGGLDACIQAGLTVDRGTRAVLPLMRQVQIVIGTVSSAGAGLALLKDPRFAVIPLFTGLGLLFAGLTGTCGLALLLARMPWNRRRAGAGAGDKGGGCCTVGER
jgi:rhodanese-related sulfurtransferase